jgi:copper chaperone CopZ
MSITKELVAVPGVSDVQVDHATGKARLHATEAVSPAALEQAVEEAGYRATAISELQ